MNKIKKLKHVWQAAENQTGSCIKTWGTTVYMTLIKVKHGSNYFIKIHILLVVFWEASKRDFIFLEVYQKTYHLKQYNFLVFLFIKVIFHTKFEKIFAGA